MKNLTKNLLYNYLMEIERYEVESEQLRQQYFNWIDNTHYIEEFVQVFQDIIEKLEALRVYQLEAEDVKISKMKSILKSIIRSSWNFRKLQKILTLIIIICLRISTNIQKKDSADT